MQSFNDFNHNFRKLEHRCGNDKTRIEWLVKNSEKTRRLVGSLYFWEHAFESEQRKHRLLPNVPGWFIDRYKLYKQSFAPEVQRVYGLLCLRAFGVDEVDGIPTGEIFYPDGPPAPSKNDPDEVSGWFVPGVDGAEGVGSMINWVWDMHVDSEQAEDLRAGLDAWVWFIETVGLDLVGIEDRWQKLPRTMIPSHFHRGSPANGADSLIELLDDATRAYVFGLPAAAIAMCRAVCERTLKEFYFCDSSPPKGLGKLSILAEKKYEHVKKMNLRQYIDLANEVMHNHRGGYLPENELDVVRKFLETAKGLIEQAPKPPTK